MRLLPDFNRRSPVRVTLLPSDRFFLRLVPLAPDLAVRAQIELALEGLAPFPLAQLYWGYWVVPGSTTALVYAAHRRRFISEETADWEQADLVLPDLLPLLDAIPSGSALLILAGENSLSGVAWSERSAVPAGVLARAFAAPVTDQDRRQFAAELAARAQLPDAKVTFLTGRSRTRRDRDRLIIEAVDATGAVVAATVVSPSNQEVLDIRDRAFLDHRRRERRRGHFVWKVLLAGLQAATVALLFDLGALTFRLLARSQQARLEAQTPFINKLETAHGLASRIDELTHRRLRFFEMLTAVNEARPHSVQFIRTGTSGRNGLEIEAQTNSAEDVGSYEAALRSLEVLDRVEIRDLRARDGITTFGLLVAFKPESPAREGGGL